MKMKKYIKPMILIVLSVIFAIVLIIPADLSAIMFYPGIKTKIDKIDTCMCPMWASNCQCGFLEPVGY